MLIYFILDVLRDSSCSFVSILSMFQDVEVSQNEKRKGRNLSQYIWTLVMNLNCGGYVCIYINWKLLKYVYSIQKCLARFIILNFLVLYICLQILKLINSLLRTVKYLKPSVCGAFFSIQLNWFSKYCLEHLCTRHCAKVKINNI